MGYKDMSVHVLLCPDKYMWIFMASPAQRLPLPTALRADRGAKGDVTAMSAPCMCLFAPENETPISLVPPGHV